MAQTVALFGAGGNMGTRLANALQNDPEYHILYVEAGERGLARLKERGVEPTPREIAVKEADIAVLAVPDALIGTVAGDIVADLKPGAMVVCLDPAAPYGNKLPPREDISYFITHPAHPPIFNDEERMEARRDFFGSNLAKQAIVSALMQGPEEDYARGEALSRKIFGPILRSHRVTVEQMAMLEPVLSETVTATCLTIIREAMDEAVRRGVPEAAARDFLMGHINIELAILFNETQWEFSAGCKKAIADAKEVIFRPDWKRVFDEDMLRESVRKITGD